MNKVALLIIYNHRFDRNIPILENLYKGRFSHIYHVVPFYDGNQNNVIPVYESSYYFQGYIAQAYTHLKESCYTHYFIVADDMVINPEIDETNLWDKTGLSESDCYIDNLIEMQKRENPWPRTFESLIYKRKKQGVEILNVLPSKEEAKERFDKYGLAYTRFSIRQVLRALFLFRQNFKKVYDLKRSLDYPLVGGYSDILIITGNCMKNFCSYCGAFAATDLFVEVAIPTSLVLASDNVKTNKNIILKSGAMWTKQDMDFLDEFNYSYKKLEANFPKDKFYLHPIKLSKWK